MKHAKKWKYQVLLSCKRLYICDLQLKTAKLTLTRCSSIECDFDGLVGSFKHITDALVEAGVIENDKPSNIGQSVFLWEKAKPKQGKVRIKIETTER
ncbi:MAG TPA: hypothetical protein PLQ20_02065 [Candidatus Paceibacterota bacterium]|nr:hypothetical protein [Candidatus Paceibacterota bacterium]